MGLKSVFQNAAKTVLNVAGDVRKDVRYFAVASTTYDVSAGVASVIGRNHFISMFFETYAQKEIDDVHIKPSDVKAIFAQLDVTHLTPRLSDSVHVCDAYGSTEYELVNIDTDPADAQWILQLRARGKGTL